MIKGVVESVDKLFVYEGEKERREEIERKGRSLTHSLYSPMVLH